MPKGRGRGWNSLEPEVLAQIDFSYAFIINDFLWLAVGEHHAVVDNVGAVADAEGLSDVVVGNQHAAHALLEEPNDLLDVEHRDRIDAGEWLVEQDEARMRRQRP